MRRWRIWIAAALVLIAGSIVLLSNLPAAPRYDFLKGKAPLSVQVQPEGERFVHEPFPDEIYSFEGDFEALLVKAEQELQSKGFERWSERYRGMTARPDMVAFTPTSSPLRTSRVAPSTWKEKTVRLRKDIEVPSAGPLTRTARTRKGWVTVEIINHQPPSLLENLMSWLRL